MIPNLKTLNLNVDRVLLSNLPLVRIDVIKYRRPLSCRIWPLSSKNNGWPKIRRKCGYRREKKVC